MAIRFLCWHNWSKWEDLQLGKVTEKEVVIGRYLIQQRDCCKCGKKQLSKTRVLV